MEFIRAGNRNIFLGDEYEVCTKGEDCRCFKARIVELGGEVVLDRAPEPDVIIPLDKLIIGHDEKFRFRPIQDPLTEKVLKILRERS